MSIVRAEDNEALHLNTFSVAIGVAVVHFLSGIALLINNGGLRTTPLFFLATFFHYNAIPVAGIFTGTALLAIAPFLVRSPSRALFHDLCRPAAVLAPAPFCVGYDHGVDRPVPGDGYIPEGGTYFIFVDQVWLLMICIWHLIEYIRAL